MPDRDLSAFLIVTSNANKLAEFRRFGLPVAADAGADLPEVDGDKVEVVLHKALAAGEGRIVEDTSLDVDGAEVGVNVRWLLDRVAELDGRRAVWEVVLGLNDGEAVEVYRAAVAGVIRAPAAMPERPFGFDPVFVPDGAGGLSLHELDALGRKDDFSPRRRAVERLLAGDGERRLAADIAPWAGGWQAKGP